jgi:hypothetical protein
MLLALRTSESATTRARSLVALRSSLRLKCLGMMFWGGEDFNLETISYRLV